MNDAAPWRLVDVAVDTRPYLLAIVRNIRACACIVDFL